jgi:hypothetical protein
VFADIAVSVFPQCAVTPEVRRLGKANGLPRLAPIEMVLHRKAQGVSDAAEQLAQHIARELANTAVSPEAPS